MKLVSHQQGVKTNELISKHVHTRGFVLVSLVTMGSITYGLRTADYGLGLKHRLRYKTWTKQYGLGIKHGLLTECGLSTFY